MEEVNLQIEPRPVYPYTYSNCSETAQVFVLVHTLLSHTIASTSTCNFPCTHTVNRFICLPYSRRSLPLFHDHPTCLGKFCSSANPSIYKRLEPGLFNAIARKWRYYAKYPARRYDDKKATRPCGEAMGAFCCWGVHNFQKSLPTEDLTDFMLELEE